MKFYEIILDKTQAISIPVALKIAQNWLRNLTVKTYKIENCEKLIQKKLQNLPSKEFRRRKDIIEAQRFKLFNRVLDN